MQPDGDQVQSFKAKLRAQRLNRARSAAVIGILLALLLWQTRWPSLRPGPIVLMICYGGTAALLSYRAFGQRRPEYTPKVMNWFDEEQSFATRLILFESVTRTAGFLLLGEGFWVATHSLWIALALGLAYPAFAYLAVERPNYQRGMRALRVVREAAAGRLAEPE